MRIEPQDVKAIRLYDADRLDPIFVVIQDLGHGSGRLVIECYGDAWAGYWGAMGDNTMERFLLSCSATYIAGKMLGAQHKRTKQSEGYILRIITALQAALTPKSEGGKQ